MEGGDTDDMVIHIISAENVELITNENISLENAGHPVEITCAGVCDFSVDDDFHCTPESARLISDVICFLTDVCSAHYTYHTDNTKRLNVYNVLVDDPAQYTFSSESTTNYAILDIPDAIKHELNELNDDKWRIIYFEKRVGNINAKKFKHKGMHVFYKYPFVVAEYRYPSYDEPLNVYKIGRAHV